MIILFGLQSTLMFTFIISTTLGKVFYTVWVPLIFFSFSGIFSLMPAVVTTTYGPTHANTIYGMLFTAPVCLHQFTARPSIDPSVKFSNFSNKLSRFL